MNLFRIKLALVAVALISCGALPTAQLDESDLGKANRLADTITASEWLGALAPIAISPFFGITCLAGLSQLSAGTFLENNHFISSNPVLHNPYVFWIFLALTLLTSLPRLTKISKPIAQALDQVETYAGIITLLVIRIAASSGGQADAETVVLSMGLVSLTFETLLCLAAVFNIIVINTVRFFLEILAWLTPVPAIDALLEVTNKSVCACLIAIYAYSPVAATALNLLLFFACLIVFRWIHRRVVYARHIFLDPILTLLFPRYGIPHHGRIQVFNQADWGPFPAKSKLFFEITETGWRISQQRLFLPDKGVDLERSTRIELAPGLFTNQILLTEGKPGGFVFTRRYVDHLDQIAQQMSLLRIEGEESGDGRYGLNSL
ncbi:MAG: hypothetical protein MK108_13965 [Mariniblastus sp.]|nr:hypothetical protein [Mariniblastus sp.]